MDATEVGRLAVAGLWADADGGRQLGRGFRGQRDVHPDWLCRDGTARSRCCSCSCSISKCSGDPRRRRTSTVRRAAAGPHLPPIEGGAYGNALVLPGGDNDRGLRRARRVRSRRRHRPSLRRALRRGTPLGACLGGPRMGRQRGLAGGRRRRPVFRLPPGLCLGVPGILPAAHNRALAPHPARHRDRVSQQGLEPRVVAALGRGLRRRQRDARDLLRRRDRQRRARRSA